MLHICILILYVYVVKWSISNRFEQNNYFLSTYFIRLVASYVTVFWLTFKPCSSNLGGENVNLVSRMFSFIFILKISR